VGGKVAGTQEKTGTAANCKTKGLREINISRKIRQSKEKKTGRMKSI